MTAVRPAELAGQLARFATVGASNTVVTFATYAALTALGVAVPAAGAIGFVAGGVNGYFLNRGWTSPARLAALALPRLAGEAVVLPCVTLITFTLSRQWVFARR